MVVMQKNEDLDSAEARLYCKYVYFLDEMALFQVYAGPFFDCYFYTVRNYKLLR